MTAPRRIQRMRTKGWRMPEGCIYVGRPTRWGNLWRVWRDDDGFWCVSSGGNHYNGDFDNLAAAHRKAVEIYRQNLIAPGPHHHRLLSPVPTLVDVIRELRGRDLCCWCPLDQPCHADVLLELAR